MGVLRVCRWLIDVDDGVLRLASTCSYLDAFRTSAPSNEARVRLVRCDRHAGERWIPLDGAQPESGAYAIRGSDLLACIPDEPAAAEASLRALFQLAILRQGGLLLHGAGLCFEGKAVVATGASGAGKSTLARLCVQAGGGLLSDETVGLHPDGTVFGSPFFSDEDLIGEANSAQLSGIFALEKGDSERIATVGASEGTALILGQAYRPPPGEGTRAALLERATALALHSGAHRLTFRKHEAAGLFVKRWVVGEAR